MTRLITIADVIAATCEVSGLSREDIIGQNKKPRIVEWRHAAMLIAYELTGSSLAAIARCMGDRDHTTILHGRISAQRRIETVPGYAERLALIRERSPGASLRRPKTVEPIPEFLPLPQYNDGRRLTTQAGHVDRNGNLICNP